MVDDGPSQQVDAVPEPVRIWEAVTRTFRFLSRNILAFLLMTAVVLVPILLYQSRLIDRAEAGMADTDYRNARLSLFGIYPLSTLLLQAGVTLAVFQHLRGRPVRLFASLRRGLIALVPIVIMAFLLLLFWGMAIALARMPTTILFEGGDREGTGKIVNLVVSLIAFVWIGSTHLVCTQALVVERLSIFGALARSRDLTLGSRGRIAGLLVVAFVARWLLTLALYPAIIDPSASRDAYRLAASVDASLNTLFVVFIAVCGVVIYCDLRRAKDGVDINELVRVFEG